MAQVAITGNTYPVKDQIKALGGRWNPDQKAWMVPAEKASEAQKLVSGAVSEPRKPNQSYHPHKCCVCGATAWDGIRGHRGVRIYRSGECQDCFEERKMGY